MVISETRRSGVVIAHDHQGILSLDHWEVMLGADRWTLSSFDDLPERFADPRCDDFRVVCSNGWEGGISIGSAFDHKPPRWPQCFPQGADGDACCTRVVLRREGASKGEIK